MTENINRVSICYSNMSSLRLYMSHKEFYNSKEASLPFVLQTKLKFKLKTVCTKKIILCTFNLVQNNYNHNNYNNSLLLLFLIILLL